MSEFKIKSYRVEWQIVDQPHGQYGEPMGEGKVLARLPTREQALDELGKYGNPHPHLKETWVPKEDFFYRRIEVQYREVPIKAAGQQREEELLRQIDRQRETIQGLERRMRERSQWWTERDDSNENMKRQLKDKLAEMIGVLERNMK